MGKFVSDWVLRLNVFENTIGYMQIMFVVYLGCNGDRLVGMQFEKFSNPLFREGGRGPPLHILTNIRVVLRVTRILSFYPRS